MPLAYRISLWNYTHYANTGSLEETVQECAQAGFGVELWPDWKDDRRLFSPIYRERLRLLLSDIPSSFHGSGARTMEEHQEQIDCAAYTRSDVIVVHPNSLNLAPPQPDYPFAREVVARAAERQVTIALENGPLPLLADAIAHIESLGICFDTGHAYCAQIKAGKPSPSIAEYLDILKPRLVHLHLQDAYPDTDHYTLGTGMMSPADWELLLLTLAEINYRGAAVFEIRPYRPLQTAAQSIAFLAACAQPQSP